MDWDTKNRHRLVWPTQVGGFLVSIGFLTGLANMAFFPSAICAQGHAGNFIAVYIICVIIIGFPLTYLHLCLGQYSGCNPTNVFSKLCPAFKGIGWSWLLLMIPVMVISNMNTSWSLYYMYVSGNSIITGRNLPWGYQIQPMMTGTELPNQLIDYLSIVDYNRSSKFNPFIYKRPYDVQTTTPDHFHHLYHTSAPEIVMSIDEDKILRVVHKKIVLGNIEIRMVISLAISWIIVCMCTMHNSVHTMNRIVYVTATLPLLILTLLFARVIYLPGAWDGIKLLYPTIDRIMEKSVWQSAMKLIFFDMQIGVGVLISISKHNRFHTNVFRDAVLMVTIDMIVSLLAACVAFGFLGFMAFKLETTDIRAMCRGQTAPHLLWDQILRSMTFLHPNEASVYSFLYQLMLALGALECTFTLCESFASALDCKISFLNDRPHLLRGIVAILLFFLTIPCCFQSGVHIYNLLVHYSMHWNLKIVALCQFVVIVYIYGIDNLFKDITLMLRLPNPELQPNILRLIGPTGIYIKHTWTWVSPAVIFVAIIFDLFIKESNHYQKKVGDSIFWHFISIISILPLPIFFIYYFYKKDKTAFEATAWKSLQMPFDDSTISNTTLLQEVELDNISLDRSKDCIVPLDDEYQTIITSLPKQRPVNFVVSNPYFDKSSYYISKPTLFNTTNIINLPTNDTNIETNDFLPILQNTDDNEDDINNDLDEFNNSSNSDSSEFESKFDSSSSTSIIDFTALTGQPSFITTSITIPTTNTTDNNNNQEQTLQNMNDSDPPPEYEST